VSHGQKAIAKSTASKFLEKKKRQPMSRFAKIFKKQSEQKLD
jgi:hypothetical protein